jgi:glycosyltransferase involved in cell wall biosynthesis
MISVIVCSKTDPDWLDHQRNIKGTIGTAYEYIRIDNRDNTYGLCSAYNEGVHRAKGDILVFVHEDVFFMEPGWGLVLEKKMVENSSIGLIGLAGTQYFFKDNRYWCAAGTPFTRGRVIQITNDHKILLTIFSPAKDDAEVVTVDGLFIAIRGSLFSKIAFDADTFDGFHFYDHDISMQVRKYAKCMVTWDILVKHVYLNDLDDAFYKYGLKFIEKYNDEA